MQRLRRCGLQSSELMFPKHLDATDLHAKDRSFISRDRSVCSSHSGSLKCTTHCTREFRSLPPVTSLQACMAPHAQDVSQKSHAYSCQAKLQLRTQVWLVVTQIFKSWYWSLILKSGQESVNIQFTGTYHTNLDSRWHTVLSC